MNAVVDPFHLLKLSAHRVVKLLVVQSAHLRGWLCDVCLDDTTTLESLGLERGHVDGMVVGKLALSNAVHKVCKPSNVVLCLPVSHLLDELDRVGFFQCSLNLE